MFHDIVDRRYSTYNGLQRPTWNPCTITEWEHPRHLRIVNIVAAVTAEYAAVHTDRIHVCWGTLPTTANRLARPLPRTHAHQRDGASISVSTASRSNDRPSSTSIDARTLRAKRLRNVDTRHLSNAPFCGSCSSTISTEACVSSETQRPQLRCLQRTKSQVRRNRHVQLFRVL